MNVRDPRIDALAQKLAAQTGESPTEAVIRALEEKLQRQPAAAEPPADETAKRADRERRKAAILAILKEMDKLPVLDNRTPDEMLYDEDGLPV